MQSRKSKACSEEHIRQDFLDAIDNIKRCRPKNAELREKIRQGKKIALNISTVAKEAGRARSLIARKDSAYPDIRNLVLEENVEVKGPVRSSHEVIASLRQQLAETKAELARIKEHATDHFQKRHQAERKLGDANKEIARLNRTLKEITSPKVVKMSDNDR